MLVNLTKIEEAVARIDAILEEALVAESAVKIINGLGMAMGAIEALHTVEAIDDDVANEKLAEVRHIVGLASLGVLVELNPEI